MNILRCADEAVNASDALNTVCNTDIYTTKVIKQPEPYQSYFSYLKSFIAGEHESKVKEREGIIILSLDGVYEEELIQVLIDMKKRNDKGVRDVRINTFFNNSWFWYLISLEKIIIFSIYFNCFISFLNLFVSWHKKKGLFFGKDR